MYKIKSNDQRQMSLLFWLIAFFSKDVPAKGLDPASQALLNSEFNKLQVLDRP